MNCRHHHHHHQHLMWWLNGRAHIMWAEGASNLCTQHLTWTHQTLIMTDGLVSLPCGTTAWVGFAHRWGGSIGRTLPDHDDPDRPVTKQHRAVDRLSPAGPWKQMGIPRKDRILRLNKRWARRTRCVAYAQMSPIALCVLVWPFGKRTGPDSHSHCHIHSRP